MANWGNRLKYAARSITASTGCVAVQAANVPTLTPSILSALESSTFWTGGIDAEHFERVLTATLKRGERHPEIPRDAIRALAAAEGVAIAEGRGPVTPPDGMAQLVVGFAQEHADRADPLGDATIELALRAVQCVRDAASWEQREYASEEGRAAFRAEVARRRVLRRAATDDGLQADEHRETHPKGFRLKLQHGRLQ